MVPPLALCGVPGLTSPLLPSPTPALGYPPSCGLLFLGCLFFFFFCCCRFLGEGGFEGVWPGLLIGWVYLVLWGVSLLSVPWPRSFDVSSPFLGACPLLMSRPFFLLFFYKVLPNLLPLVVGVFWASSYAYPPSEWGSEPHLRYPLWTKGAWVVSGVGCGWGCCGWGCDTCLMVTGLSSTAPIPLRPY